jgi:hypothetical protein
MRLPQHASRIGVSPEKGRTIFKESSLMLFLFRGGAGGGGGFTAPAGGYGFFILISFHSIGRMLCMVTWSGIFNF